MVRLRVKDFKVKVLVTQSCPTFCDHMDCRPSDSPVHGILQARILECVAIPFSRGSSWPRDGTRVQCCRQVLYHLSHQGSPESLRNTSNIFLRILLVHLFKTNKQKKQRPCVGMWFFPTVSLSCLDLLVATRPFSKSANLGAIYSWHSLTSIAVCFHLYISLASHFVLTEDA